MTHKKAMRRILKKFWWLIILIVIAIIIVFVLVKGSDSEYEYTTETVARGDLVQTVDATGKVQSAEEVSLSFQTTGVVKDLFAAVGQEVLKDDPIIGLDDRELKFQLAQADANLRQAQADLNRQLAGASSQDINVSQITANKAYIDYQNAIEELTTLQTKLEKDIVTYEENLAKSKKAYEDSQVDLGNIGNTQDQTVENYKDTLLILIEDSVADMHVSLDEIYKVIEETYFDKYIGQRKMTTVYEEVLLRGAAERSIELLESEFENISISSTDDELDSVVNVATVTLENMFAELRTVYEMLRYSLTSVDFTSTDLNSYKTSISAEQVTISSDLSSLRSAYQNLVSARISKQTQQDTYQSALNSAENSYNVSKANYDLAVATKDSQLTSQENKIEIAKSAWELAVSQLDLKAADPRYVDIAPNQARVAQMQAAYELAQKKFEDAVIKAPIDGTATSIEYEIGEQVTASSAKPHVVKMENLNGFEIEVDISESDIAKIEQDDEVEITLDAFGDDELFMGTVSSIDPGETVIQDVIYYSVKIVFDPSTEKQVKPGMTANTLIFTESRTGTLFVPRRAVIENNGSGKVVRILDGNTHKEISVETGLRADNGLIEIISGLEEGQEIVTYMKKLK